MDGECGGDGVGLFTNEASEIDRLVYSSMYQEGFHIEVSPKGEKPSPRIVFGYGKQDEQIKSFLNYRQMIKNIARKIGV